MQNFKIMLKEVKPTLISTHMLPGVERWQLFVAPAAHLTGTIANVEWELPSTGIMRNN